MSSVGGKGRYAIVNARVFDGTGRPLIENGVVVINGNVIVDVGTRGSVEVPDDVEVIDVGGRFVMPGLIDAHVHLFGRRGDRIKEQLLVPFSTFVARVVKDLEELINAGFTTVRDAGSVIALEVKPAIAEGTVVGPRVVAAGYIITQTFGHGDVHYLPPEWVDVRTSKKVFLSSLICDGVDECRKAARYALRQGADYIKICSSGGVMSEKDRPEYVQFTVDEIKAIVQEARHAMRFVASHAQSAEGIKNAIIAGVKTIEHGIYIDEEGVELAKERDVIVVPTFSVVEHVLKYGKEVGVPEWGLKKAEEVYKDHVENIRKAYRAGVKIASGTDFGGGVKAFRHGLNALEIQLLTEKLGMTPTEALIAATKVAAEACGMGGSIGTLERGKVADIIVIDGNPLDDVKILQDHRKIALVMKEGRVVKNLLTM